MSNHHAPQNWEEVYAEWEEAERKHAHIMSVHQIIDTLGDSEADRKELQYQKLRLQFSPAYFSGHPAYCGERLNHLQPFDQKHYSHTIRQLAVCVLLRHPLSSLFSSDP